MFDQVYKRNQKKISVLAQSVSMFQNHMLPMIQIVDKKSSEIVSQVFNFIDTIGEPLSVEAIEDFLRVRGILEPPAKFTD